MGIATGCSGHKLAVAQCCVTRDYVRAEAAASSESRRAGCHLRTPGEDFFRGVHQDFISNVTLQYATKLLNHYR